MPDSAINIQISPGTSASYKSIDTLHWDNVPMFVVLSGENGSGKSQLLELLARHITQTVDPATRRPPGMAVDISGQPLNPSDVAYLPSRQDNPSTMIANIQALHSERGNVFAQLGQDISYDVRQTRKRSRIEQRLGVPLHLAQASPELASKIFSKYEYMVEDLDIMYSAAVVFFAYKLQLLDLLAKDKTRLEAEEEIGTPPWETLNKALKSAGFRYEIPSPMETSITEDYNIKFIDISNGVSISIADLSSGEQMILRILAMLFASETYNVFPKLLLLDEPDAHLHPSLSYQFMDILQKIFVDRYNIRVIMTTHSPSTVALAPEGSIYVMSRDQPRITKARSKLSVIGLLTAGLVLVSRTTRFVFVEDEDDALFYGMIKEVLSDYSSRKDKMALAPAPSIVFLSASIGTGKAKTSGGESKVRAWIEKFDLSLLDTIFLGLVDRDFGASPPNRVFVIGRYSLENYLLDPIVVFGLLCGLKLAPFVQGVMITPGNEHQISELNDQQLQSVVTTICAIVGDDHRLSSLPKDLIEVRFTNGAKLYYPQWVLDFRGHDLMAVYQHKFGGPKAVTPPRLREYWQRVRMMPVELAEIMRKIQTWVAP